MEGYDITTVSNDHPLTPGTLLLPRDMSHLLHLRLVDTIHGRATDCFHWILASK